MPLEMFPVIAISILFDSTEKRGNTSERKKYLLALPSHFNFLGK